MSDRQTSTLIGFFVLFAAAEDEADAEGERMSHSPTGVLSSIAGTLQQLVDDDQLAEDFPPNTTEIPTGAFEWCWDLVSVELPAALTYIGQRAFYESGLVR